MSSSTGVFGFIQQQSPLFVNKLYGNVEQKCDISQAAWVCRGVLQSLCPLAKCYVMRLIFIETAISSIDIFRWCESDQRGEHDKAIKELLQLRIFSEVDIPATVEAQQHEQWFLLNPYFRNSIKFGMIHLTRPWEAAVAARSHDVELEDKGMAAMDQRVGEGESGSMTGQLQTESAPSLSQLEAYSSARWNMILEFLVTADCALPVSPRVVSYLLAAGLMQPLGGGEGQGQYAAGNKPPQKRVKTAGALSQEPLSITAKGYECMLLDVQSQVWLFVLECLKRAPSCQVDLLYLIFMLSFCRRGEGHSLALLSASQQLLLQDLCDMGLVFITAQEGGAQLFYPTQIAINMLHITPASSAATGTESARSCVSMNNAMDSVSLTIIVETNFQVVAYVNSNLHLAMLSLFVDTRSMIRLPNMVLGNITRDSAKAAFRLGITAQQIIGFLVTHAHPLPARTRPVIPENISDQLKLWQAEKKRYKCQEAVVVDLHDVAEGAYLATLYEQLVGYARDLQVLVWASAKLREFAVTPEGFPRVQAFAETLDHRTAPR